jgi:hypothetical protein
MTTVTCQLMTGETMSFTLREDIEIADLKEAIALHFNVHEKRIVLSISDDDEFVLCKDYREVVSGDHFYLVISDVPHYKLYYKDEYNIVISLDDSVIASMPTSRLHFNRRWHSIVRHLYPEQPYVLSVGEDDYMLKIVLNQLLQQKYFEIDRIWHANDESEREINEEDRRRHVPKQNTSIELCRLLLQNSMNTSYLVKEFIVHYGLLNNQPFTLELYKNI